jgi:hypothetical protein
MALQFLGTFANLRKTTISFVMSPCLSDYQSARNNSAPTERIFTKVYICIFFENLSRKIQVSLKRDKNTSTLNDKNTSTLKEDQHTCFIISLKYLLRMRSVSDKVYREKNSHFVSVTVSSKIIPFIT